MDRQSNRSLSAGEKSVLEQIAATAGHRGQRAGATVTIDAGESQVIGGRRPRDDRRSGRLYHPQIS